MEFTIEITGIAPLLMHNGRLSNPIDPIVKEMKSFTSKRKKTDEDHEAIARIEHAGSLYLDPDVGPFIPADNVHRALIDGAKKHKLGVRVKEGVLITTLVNPIAYKGPRDPDGLWSDKNHVHSTPVKVGTSRTIRTRPIFPVWRLEADGILDESVLEVRDLQQAANTAGSLIGLGDWRPKYGRFTAVIKTNGGRGE